MINLNIAIKNQLTGTGKSLDYIKRVLDNGFLKVKTSMDQTAFYLPFIKISL